MCNPSMSKAAVLETFGEKLVIKEIPIPSEIEEYGLLVKTEVASICGTDLHLASGNIALHVDLPVILGHEMVGTIVKFGENSDKDSLGQQLKEGDRVLWSHASCGKCFYCVVQKNPNLCTNRRQYMYESCEKHPYLMGGFSEYGYVLPTAGRVKIPDNVNNELASLSSCAFRSVMNSFDQLGKISTVDSVVIQGAGPLGLLATAVAKKSGAKQIFVIGAPDNRLELAREMGADIVYSVENSREEERYQDIMKHTNQLGASIVMEFSGSPYAFREGLNLIAKEGRYVVVGQLGNSTVEIKPSIITSKNLKIIGSYSGDISHYWKALEFISLYQNEFPFEKLITTKYKLAEINEAMHNMKLQKEIKPIIVFD